MDSKPERKRKADTRRRPKWSTLTPRSPTQTGDIVDVWDYDDDRWFRGVYIGFCNCTGSPRAEVESLDGDCFWAWSRKDRVTIRLVRESRVVAPSEEKSPRDFWLLFALIAAAWMVGIVTVLWIFSGR